MEWFKHFSDMHEGRSINNLMDELGHTGLCFFLIQEMCAGKLALKPHEAGTEADCKFSFHTRVVRERLRLSHAKMERLLSVAQANGLLSYAVVGSTLQIDMPILLDLREKDSRKARRRREAGVQMVSQELELELDKELELEKELSRTAQAPVSQPAEVIEISQAPTTKNIELNRRIWNSYRDAYIRRWNKEPVRNAKVNRNISDLGKRLGEDAVAVIQFYVGHNKAYYVEHTHDVGLCLKDAESLHTQWANNQPITRNEVRQMEQNEFYRAQMERMGQR